MKDGPEQSKTIAAAEARGFARGIEAAAKWHEKEAEGWQKMAEWDRSRGMMRAEDRAAGFAVNHRDDAAAIRALSLAKEPPR